MTGGGLRRRQVLVPAFAWLHRWLGIALGLLFAMWFASGAVMLFVPFPALSAAERLARAESVDLARVRVAPAAALAHAPDATSLRLVAVDGAPVYVAEGGQATVAVDAVRGGRRPALDAATAGRIAARFGSAAVASVEAVDTEQWVVHQGFDAGRPYFRVALADAARTEVYVSACTGEVAQRTTRGERAFNGVGAVLHWLYFTPLRSNWAAWDAVVWWLSLAGVAAAASGLGLGVWRFAQARRQSGAGFRWFRSGWMRWHHVLGLTAGVTVATWILSGWLSMDHGRLFSTPAAAPGALDAFRGGRLAEVLATLPAPATEAATRAEAAADSGVREIRYAAVAGHAVTVLRRAAGAELSVDGAAVSGPGLSDALLLQAARAAWPYENASRVAVRDRMDVVATAEGLPSDARVVFLASSSRQVYLDASSGTVLAVVDASRRRYAWWYHVLHTGRHPVAESWEPLRIAVLLLLLAGGFALSVTALVVGWRRLFRRAA